MKKFNNGNPSGMGGNYFQGSGIGMGMQPANRFGQQQMTQQQQQQQFYLNQQQQRQFMGNQDLMNAQYEDAYYDDETDEEEAYRLQLQQNGLNPLLAQQLMNNQLGNVDPTIAKAEQLLGEGFEIMEEEMSENYDPTAEEIEEYAKYLGMDTKDDTDLFYIAKEGLKAPLPDPWKPCRSPGGNIYYFNFETQDMQKEHPCDDYYKKYYQQERVQRRKKKEEKVIKKQIQEQKKKEKMSNSMNSTSNPNPTNNSMIQNNSIQMAMMMNMSGVDTSVILNEKLQLELEQLMDEYEEQKIIHERRRRDELKKLEQDKKDEKKRISEDAKVKVEIIKKENEGFQSNSTDMIKTRKAELQLEKEKRLRDLKNSEHQKLQEKETQFQKKIEKQKTDLQKEEERRHKMESENLKSKYQTKLQIEKDKVIDANNRLLEESGDIDFQVRLFKQEMLDSQVDEQKYAIEDEHKRKVSDIKTENKKKLEKERVRIQQDFESKLDREREKEMRKLKLEQSKIEDKKEEIRKQYNIKTRDEKKRIEKEINEKNRQRRIEEEDETDRMKMEIKKQVQKTFEIKQDRQNKDHENFRQDLKTQQQQYELKQKQDFEMQKQKIDREFEEDWQKEKHDQMKNENEKSESYQQIINDIQKLKSKIKDLQAKEHSLSSHKKSYLKQISDLEMELRSKQRQLKQSDNLDSDRDQLLERQLKDDIKDKQLEIDRINEMIRERRLANTASGESHEYKKISREIDQVKQMVMELKQNSYQRPVRNRKPVQNVLNYPIAEIEAFLDLNLPQILHKLKKHQEDRLLIRQLIANIDRNRIKMRKELNGGQGCVLSADRRLVVQSIKEKIDDQALILANEEQTLKDKCDYYRRKEEKLRVIKAKVDVINGKDKFEELIQNDDKREALLKDVQVDYDKYLKLYQKDDYQSNRVKTQARNQDLLLFSSKWHDYLQEEAQHDMIPLVSADPYQSLFKPHSLYKRYELSDSAYKSRVAVNHVYEREAQKVQEQRSKIRDFLSDQQKWITNLRTEISGPVSAVPASRSGMNHVVSNQSLFQLKNNLSHILVNY